jgi:hypothetical protein
LFWRCASVLDRGLRCWVLNKAVVSVDLVFWALNLVVWMLGA